MQEKLSKLKYKFKTEVKSGKSGYMLYAAVLAGILCIAVLKTGGKEQSQTQTIVRPDYTDSADNIELEVLAEGEEKPFLVELEVSPRQYDESSHVHFCFRVLLLLYCRRIVRSICDAQKRVSFDAAQN